MGDPERVGRAADEAKRIRKASCGLARRKTAGVIGEVSGRVGGGERLLQDADRVCLLPISAFAGVVVGRGEGFTGAADDGTHTTDADSNLSFADFVQGSSASQYLTVTDDGSGWVKLGFFGQSVTGTATALGSVELDGVAYGAGAGQYDTVEELFTAGVLDATMDGFHVGLLTNVV